MSRFLETDIREQKKYDKGIQTSVDNAVNDPRYESKFENPVKYKKIIFLLSEIFFIKPKYFLKKNMFYSWRSIFLRFLRI